MQPSNENNRESELAAEVQAQAEEIAELKHSVAAEVQMLSVRVDELENAIGETCKLLGHEGNDAADLHDAIGQIERLLADQDRDGIPLTGLAAKLRQRIHSPSVLQLSRLVNACVVGVSAGTPAPALLVLLRACSSLTVRALGLLSLRQPPQ